MYCGTCKGDCRVYVYDAQGNGVPGSACCHDLVRYGYCQHQPLEGLLDLPKQVQQEEEEEEGVYIYADGTPYEQGSSRVTREDYQPRLRPSRPGRCSHI